MPDVQVREGAPPWVHSVLPESAHDSADDAWEGARKHRYLVSFVLVEALFVVSAVVLDRMGNPIVQGTTTQNDIPSLVAGLLGALGIVIAVVGVTGWLAYEALGYLKPTTASNRAGRD